MVRIIRPIACVLLAGWFSLGNQSAWGQGGAASPEAVRAPAPIPEATYGPLQASRDAYEHAQQRRRQVFERQLDLVSQIDWYNTWVRPYVGTLPEVYVAPTPRAWRRYARGGYGPVFTPWPIVPGDVYGYPYRDRVPQPLGHEKTYTGPNGYVYRPIYPRPDGPEQVPTPAPRPVAAPEAPPPPVQPDVRAESIPQGPVLNPPALPRPEVIPTPPVSRGPREF